MDAYEISIYKAVAITVVLIAVLIVLFIGSVIRNQKPYFEERIRQIVAELRLQEEASVRVARDLHDGIGPHIAMSRLIVQRVLNGQAGIETLVQVDRTLEMVVSQTGRMARSLAPGSFLQKGLKPVLDDFFELCRQASSPAIEFRYQVKSSIAPEAAIHIFRMVQEIVYNTIRHSGASLIRVELTEREESLFLVCEDDGRGFREEQRSGSGLGLESLKGRLWALGGRMQFTSGEGEGTRYFIELPLSRNYGNDQDHTGRG
jgi:signal transduction histidine kinase